MHSEAFEAVLDRRLSLTRQVLALKRKEYAGNELRLGYDRLHNFNRSASMLSCSREKALIGMLSKHLVSILDIVDDLDIKFPSVEMIEEKIGDAINYLILLEAMMKEDGAQNIKEAANTATNSPSVPLPQPFGK